MALRDRRKELLAEFDGAPVSLGLYMGSYLVWAAEDLTWVPAGVLHRRFLGPVSVIRRGDERFHYSDGSHKWIPPDPDFDQEVWDAMVRQHQQQHLEEISRRHRPRRSKEDDLERHVHGTSGDAEAQ